MLFIRVRDDNITVENQIRMLWTPLEPSTIGSYTKFIGDKGDKEKAQPSLAAGLRQANSIAQMHSLVGGG